MHGEQVVFSQFPSIFTNKVLDGVLGLVLTNLPVCYAQSWLWTYYLPFSTNLGFQQRSEQAVSLLKENGAVARTNGWSGFVLKL